MPELLIGLLEPQKHPLALKFYRSTGFSVNVGRNDRVVVAKYEQTIIAALKLMPRSDESWFLRGMCVASSWRRQGVGTDLLEGAVPVTKRKPCYCFVFNHLEDFYRRGGFHTIEGDSVPLDLQQAHQRYSEQGKKLITMALNV